MMLPFITGRLVQYWEKSFLNLTTLSFFYGYCHCEEPATKQSQLLEVGDER